MASSDDLTTIPGAIERGMDRELWIVTARSGERTGGLLATFVSFCSIVPEMPRVLVGIGKSHATWDLIEASGAFACHLLRPEQGPRALRFAMESGRTIEKLAGIAHHVETTGSPILDDAPAWLDCRVEARFDTGDRTFFLGAIVAARQLEVGPVLKLHDWFSGLSIDDRRRLGENRGRDAALDAAAIEAWRNQHPRG